MNLSKPITEIPALADDFKRAREAEILQQFEVEKHYTMSVRRYAQLNYIVKDHQPTIDTVNEAVRLNKGFANYNVLITGPSGTGKEIIAKIIGYDDVTSYVPRIKALNMSGLTDTLFESQLFGYVPGAFTGALSKGHPGFLRACGKSVAFLDEIGELPLSQQAKILRVLQEREVTPVGGVDAVKIDCRFVFATNKDLPAMVEAGTFREDLYFRISQITLRTYSLEERGDVETRAIADSIIRDNAWTPLDVSEYVPAAMFRRGNVRALFNLLLSRERGTAKLPTYS